MSGKEAPDARPSGSKNLYMYSPSCYIGISRRLTEPGNEEKLENAVKLRNRGLSLLTGTPGNEHAPDFSHIRPMRYGCTEEAALAGLEG